MASNHPANNRMNEPRSTYSQLNLEDTAALGNALFAACETQSGGDMASSPGFLTHRNHEIVNVVFKLLRFGTIC